MERMRPKADGAPLPGGAFPPLPASICFIINQFTADESVWDR